jgi:hypothetical protein
MLHSCYTTIVWTIFMAQVVGHIFTIGLIVIYLFLKKSQLTNLSRAFGPLTSHVRSQNWQLNYYHEDKATK